MGVLDPIFAPAAPWWVGRSTEIVAVTATPALGSIPAAVTFIAPASGSVLVSITADIRPTSGNTNVADWRIREGNTPGTGTIVDETFQAGFPNSTHGRLYAVTNNLQASSGPHPVALTAGQQYTAEVLCRGPSGTIQHRSILVQPVLYGP